MQQSVISKLKSIVGKEDILTSKISREVYSYDSSPFIFEPDVVLFPESLEEVVEILQIAEKDAVPVVPRGAGTCLSGGAVPLNGGISLVLTKMTKILEVDTVNETALVEAGVPNLTLQKELQPVGFMFAPDPASQKVATIGGNVAECAGGIKGVKYGVTKDHVLGLEIVLAGGTVIHTGALAPAERFTPDLTGIFSGSEGTFGVITKCLVKLTKNPEAVRTMMAVFGSLDQAGEAVSTIIARGIIPTTLEIMDKNQLRAVDDFLHLGFPREAEAVLLLEVDGYEVEIDRQVDTISGIFQEKQASSVQRARDDAEREKLWLARRSGNGALGRIKPAYMVQDVTVPRHKLPEMLRFVSEMSNKYNIIITQMAHAGDGNLHPHLLYEPNDTEEYERVEKASREIFQKAIDMEGTLTGEHGIGLEKLPFMKMQFTQADLNFMEKVKRALDPNLSLNRGKVLEL
ncbi:FAD-binding protein [Metallumcola ferriviriculae]|uniref:FAD-binding protein n=1 Tax=Metallumcola ferriviriculae TaxID=3039180 RepID=A0AAU0UKI1_9FIRM|nr:FAD-binding protein [Desulfitibacteraceae bacterium MK1]